MPQQSYKATSSSSTMSSFMCCTSDRSSKTFAYKESQSRFLWLDPTRWVEKRSKKEVGNIMTSLIHFQEIRGFVAKELSDLISTFKQENYPSLYWILRHFLCFKNPHI